MKTNKAKLLLITAVLALPLRRAAAEVFLPEPDGARTRAEEPSAADKRWFFDNVGAPAFWTLSRGSRAVKVLVCDTGVEASHPDLRGNVGPGKNFVDGTDNTAPTGNGHGTRVAGLIGARGGHDGAGAFGLNYEVTVVPGKISNAASGEAVHTDTAKCVRWGADQGIRVVNLSYGGALDNPDMQAAAKYLYEKGGLLLISAGNAGERLDLPDYPYMLAVGGTDALDWKSPWSNTGPYVDITAPGSNMYTTDAGGKYAASRGASLATAGVSGAAALILSARPDLTAGELKAVLLRSALDLGTPGRDEAFGEGRVDLKKALELLKAGPVPAN